METAYHQLLRTSGIRPRILVVDDQTINIRLVGEIFKDECDIYMAMDGEQGIAQCHTNLPDLVLLDLVMPGMDGYEVCRRLKADSGTRHIPIIFITSQRDEADEALGFALGAVDYVTKPFHQTVLRARVHTHLLMKLQADRLRSSERFMRTLTDNVPGLIAYWNADLVCLFSNASYQAYYGKTPEQMDGISLQQLFGEALFAKNEPMVQAALRGEKQQFERTMTKADGRIVFVWVQYVPDVQDGRGQGFFVLISDFSELKRAQLAVMESEKFARSIIDTVPETICVLDKTGTIIAVNQAWRDFYDANYGGSQPLNYALGTNYLQVCESAAGADATEAPLMAKGLAAVLAGERDQFSVEYPCDSPTEQRFFFARVQRFPGDSGHVLVAHGNITDRKMIELELARMAHTDVLTGLNNRRHFMQLSETELSRTSRHGGALSLLMLDIDHFKRINDTHGHQVGDAVIQMVAAVCRKQLRDLDVIGRLGGEEFAVTMPNADQAQAMAIAERLRQAIEAASVPLAQGLPVRFTVSIGVTLLSNGLTNLDTLLDQADQALYRAKNKGRNQVCGFFDTV
ncbi:MAG: diguanylate cyclase [Rhodoferax sp.]|uniref:diguanylate cyclase n=1 Tax=Rhodoferax sp. TaxID=50421 RepID=UPI003264DEB0